MSTSIPITIPKAPENSITLEKKAYYLEQLSYLLPEKSIGMVAHYYTPPEIQDLALALNGCVADSLEMARFGQQSQYKTLLVAGVRFMGETAKILSPEKTVIMPTLEAECSLDLGCPSDEFRAFCDNYPDHTVVVYANTSAKIKAQADWVVTSSIALDVIKYLHESGEKILWAPDRYLGSYIANQLGIDMVMWNGSCIVHEEFNQKGLLHLKQLHPDAALLVHPESPGDVIEIADVVGSTSQLLKASQSLKNESFIVATDQGILHQMRKHSPNKRFIEAPTSFNNSVCHSCARCPWMAMNDLEKIYQLVTSSESALANEIHIDSSIVEQALIPLERMINF